MKTEEDAARLKLIFEAANEGFFYVDRNYNVRFFNEQFYRNFDININDCSAEDWIRLVHESDRENTLLEKGRDFSCSADCEISKYRVLNRSGEYVWIEAVGKNIFDEQGEFLCVVGSHGDITEKVQRETAMQYLAYHDELTGFFNKNMISEILGEMQIEAQPGYFMYVDLKNFRSINDVINFEAGDKVLRQVGENIQSILPEGSILGRNYGDEFMIILKKERISAEDSILNEIYQIIKTPVLFENRVVEFDSRIGVFSLPCVDCSAEEIIRKTQIIISHMKDEKKTGISFYTDALRSEHIRKRELERHLLKALEKREFHVNYQPIFDIKTGKTVGYEALARWWNSEFGMVRPDEFIPLAEQTEVIHGLGDYVLREACKVGARIRKHGAKPFISVNISVFQIHKEDFVERVLGIIEASGIEKSRVLLEITESATLESGHGVVEKLKALHREGVGLSIDDFGTGYSSINSIVSLPISHLKVDRSLIGKICSNEGVHSLLEMLIAFSHKAKFKIVAEGIEDEDMLRKLEELKSDYGQGFLYSKPMTEQELDG